MPTPAEPPVPVATAEPEATSPGAPGGSPGLTRMADVFNRLKEEARARIGEGEWIATKPENGAPANPAASPTLDRSQAPGPALEGPKPPAAPTSTQPPAPAAPAPEKPKSPLDFGRKEEPAPQPTPEAPLPAEIRSGAAAEHFKKLAALRDAEKLRADELEAKAKALETELTRAKERAVDSERMELLKKENEELNRVVQTLEVTEHPKFKAYFGGKEKAISEKIMAAAGPEVGRVVLDLLKMPDTQERANALTEAIEKLPIWNQGKVTNYAIQSDELRSEKEQAIAESAKARESLVQEKQQTEQARKQELDRTFAHVLAFAQDPKQGLEVLSPKDGDEAHNAAVRAAVEQARSIFDGRLPAEDLARAAMWAAAAPMYRQAVFDQAALIRRLEDQVKSLTAVQPGLSGKQGSPEPPASPTGSAFMDKFNAAMSEVRSNRPPTY